MAHIPRTVPTVLTRAKQPARKFQARPVFIASKALKPDRASGFGTRLSLTREVRVQSQEADFAGTGFAAGTSPNAEM